MPEPALQLENAGARRGAFRLQGVNAAVPAGEALGVLGPSGCGKSTLLDAIAGLEPAAQGRVLVNGADVTRRQPHRRDVALALQDLGLWDRLSARRNVALACTSDTPDAWLDRTGFTADRDKPAANLSGGERQRVALARVLARNAAVTLLDEPGTNLDRLSNLRLAEDVSRLVRGRGGALVVVSHRLDELLRFEPAQLLVLEAGRVARQGSCADVLRDPGTLYVASLLGYEIVLDARMGEVRPRPRSATAEGSFVESPESYHAWRFGGIRESADGNIPAKVLQLLATEHGDAARVENTRGERFVIPATPATRPGAEVRLVADPPVVVRS